MFGKLFGWRKPVDLEPDDPPQAAPVPVRQRPATNPATAKLVPPEKSATGFDPYNSGAFKRQNAWEKVPRR